MGTDIYIVKYTYAKIPRNYDFHQWLQSNFMLDSGNVSVSKEELDEAVTEKPELKEKFKDELEALYKIIAELTDYDNVELSFG